MHQLYIALPGSGRQGIIPDLGDCRVIEIGVGADQQLAGICPGDGTPLKQRAYGYFSGAGFGNFRPQGNRFTIQAGSK